MKDLEIDRQVDKTVSLSFTSSFIRDEGFRKPGMQVHANLACHEKSIHLRTACTEEFKKYADPLRTARAPTNSRRVPLSSFQQKHKK